MSFLEKTGMGTRTLLTALSYPHKILNRYSTRDEPKSDQDTHVSSLRRCWGSVPPDKIHKLTRCLGKRCKNHRHSLQIIQIYSQPYPALNLLVTAPKRSLGQGNVFTGLSTVGGEEGNHLNNLFGVTLPFILN